MGKEPEWFPVVLLRCRESCATHISVPPLRSNHQLISGPVAQLAHSCQLVSQQVGLDGAKDNEEIKESDPHSTLGPLG